MNLRPRRISALVLTAAAASLCLAACGGSVSVHDRRAFRIGGTRLVINDTSSDLRVVPGNGPGIEVQRWLSGTAAKPGHSSWTLQGDTLALGIDCSGLVFSCGSRFEVAVPPGMGVTVDSGSNAVTVSSLSAPVTVKCSAGNATVRVPTAGHRYHVLVSSGTGNASSKVPDDSQAASVVQVLSDNGDVTVLPAS
jgi:hypothetical protein